MKIRKTFAWVALGTMVFAGKGFAEAAVDATGTIMSVDTVENQVVIRGESGAESTMQLDAGTIAQLKPGMTIRATLEGGQ
jgi:hypothetical protein